MASATEMRRRAQRALVDAREKVGTKATALGERARKTAEGVRARVEESRASAGPDGWRPARLAAGVAGGVLLWRALFGRGLARIPAALAGLAIVQAAFPRVARRLGSAGRASTGGRRGKRPEVVEAKSPAELERGVATGSPRPTLGSRVERGPNVPGPGDGERR
jgi:hypothetical protein